MADGQQQSMIEEGAKVPEATLYGVEGNDTVELNSQEFLGQGTIVAFGLPGAFTPTCSQQHAPRYDELAEALEEQGVDRIVCLAVNDPFVLRAWGDDLGTEHIHYVSDGNGEFTERMGLLDDCSVEGYGQRSRRYSMLIRDGRVEKLFVEEAPTQEGDPYEVSDADTMLQYLSHDQARVPDVFMLVKEGCPHCARARGVLEEGGLKFDEVEATPRMLRAVSDEPTTPRVFIDGQLIGGADELVEWSRGRRG